MTAYARAVAYVDRRNNMTIGAHTIGKEYLVHAISPTIFSVIDDADNDVLCWWDGDPDIIWEKVER